MHRLGSPTDRLKLAIRNVAFLGLGLLLANSALAATGSGSSGSSTYVYVGAGNSAGNETVYGFAVAPDGSAQPVSGSPYNGASGSLVGATHFLFGTDGTNIVTYAVNTDGGISQTSSVNGVAYDPYQQSTVGSLNLPPDGRNLYTDNVFFDGANNAYLSWAVNPSGQLSYIGSAGLPIVSTAGDSNFSFSPTGQFAYTASVCKWDGWVWGMARQGNGTLSLFNPGATSPPPMNDSQGSSVCSYTVAVSPLSYAAVAWNGSYCCGGPNLVAIYKIQSNGTLSIVPDSVKQTVANAMAFDSTGGYLAVALSNGLQVYGVQSNGTLTAIGSVVEPSVPFSNLAWDGAGHLYGIPPQYSQICQNGDPACGLYIFNSNHGVLTLGPGSPISTSQPESLVVLPPQ